MLTQLRLLTAATVVVATLACSAAGEKQPSALESSALVSISTIASPAGPQSGEPNLAVDGSGRVHLSWLERGADSTVSLKLARYENGSWSAPVTVVSRSDLFVNWADFPSVFVAPSGRIVMHWLQRRA